jgi:hypothetical protein
MNINNKKLYIGGGLIIVVACAIAAGYFFERSHFATPVVVPSQSASSTLDPLNATLGDIYPLPSGITWNAPHGTTVLPGNQNVPTPLVGIRIISQPITNITDLSAPSMLFENYYKTKLTAAGWTVDNTLAAGGPGADIIGYKKGNNYIILEYTSLFKNTGGGNSPETCPCDITFSIFAGTVK